MKSRSDATAFLKSVLMLHIASNARNYSYGIINEEPVVNKLGMSGDNSEFEGKAIELNDDWLIVKTGRNTFKVIERGLLESIPDIGATVKVTPYHRREFDGTLLGAPKEIAREGGITTTSWTIGKTDSELPIDKASIKCEFLLDLMKQVELLVAPDGHRRLSHVFIDAGALLSPVQYVDPMDENIIATPPSLTFSVDTEKHVGFVRVSYDRAMDLYDLSLINAQGDTVLVEVSNVDFMSLPETVVDLIDDGKWRIAKVEVLKKAPKQKLAA